jgi:hypothetical protein
VYASCTRRVRRGNWPEPSDSISIHDGSTVPCSVQKIACSLEKIPCSGA